MTGVSVRSRILECIVLGLPHSYLQSILEDFSTSHDRVVIVMWSDIVG